MSPTSSNAEKLLTWKIQQQLRKKQNVSSLRRRYKRKKSLVSYVSMASMSSIKAETVEATPNDDDDSNVCTRKNSLDPIVISDLTFDSSIELCHSNVINETDDDSDNVSIDYSTSEESSEDELINDAFNTLMTEDLLLEERPLHQFTRTTIKEFRIDFLNFSRVCRLPKNQRCRLLELFRKYLPAPNAVPASTEEICRKYISHSNRTSI